MNKKTLGTFVCSFAISLLAIFSASKLQLRLPEKSPENNEIKISNKNITLFVKKPEPKIIATAKSSPIDTALLPEIEGNEDIESLAGNLFAEVDLSDNPVLADSRNDEPQDIVQERIDEEILLAEFDFEGLNLDEDLILPTMDAQEFEEKMRLAIRESLSTAQKTEQTREIVEAQASSTLNTPTAEPAYQVAAAEISTDIIPIQKSSEKIIDEKIEITTKSDFNQVAMAESNAPIKSMITSDAASLNNETAVDDNPWVVAKSSQRFPTNTMALDNGFGTEDFEGKDEVKQTLSITPKATEGEVKVAEMVRNILIPIPDDILKEGNLTPQLISSKRNKDLQEKIEQNLREKRGDAEPELADESVESKEDGGPETEKQGKKTIFDSISSIFAGKTPSIGVSKVDDGEAVRNIVYTKKDKNKKKGNKVTKILPTEIKLSFQPNRAEISGQTLKWIEAFANKTIEDPTVGLEVRIDGTSSFELQQKRLGLLHNILTNKGVEYNKINTVFTTRDANSFIIRTVRMNEKTLDGRRKRLEDAERNYLNW